MKTSNPIKTNKGLYIQLQAHQKPNNTVLLYIKTSLEYGGPGESSCRITASKKATHPFRQTELLDGSLLISTLGFGAHLDNFATGEFLEFLTEIGLKMQVTPYNPGSNETIAQSLH